MLPLPPLTFGSSDTRRGRARALFSCFASRVARPRYICRVPAATARPQGHAEWMCGLQTEGECQSPRSFLAVDELIYINPPQEILLRLVCAFPPPLPSCPPSPLHPLTRSRICESKVVQQSPQFTLRKCFDTLYGLFSWAEERGGAR